MNNNYPENTENLKIKKMYFALGIFEIFSFVTLFNVKLISAFLTGFSANLYGNLSYIITILITVGMIISYFKMKPKWCAILFFANALLITGSLISDIFGGKLEIDSVSTVLNIAVHFLLSYELFTYRFKNKKLFYILIMALTVIEPLFYLVSEFIKGIVTKNIIIIITFVASTMFTLSISVLKKHLLLKIISYEKDNCES